MRIVSITLIVLCLMAAGTLWFRGTKTGFSFTQIFHRSSSERDNHTSGESEHAGSSADFLLYAHPSGRFVFHYPPAFRASTFPYGKIGDVVLLQQSSSTGAMQIFVMPFDEPGPLTSERIHRDLPDKVVENPQEILIGVAHDTRALLFSSTGKDVGATREVWFVVDGYLYQAVTAPVLESTLGKILATIEF